MKNADIARLFSRMADMIEITGGNPFRVLAYRRAALNLESLPRSVEDLSREEILAIPGIGADLADKIGEFLRTGTIAAEEELRDELPPGILDLLAVPGLGPKTARVIVDHLPVASLDDLERAALEHRLAGLPGIQEKTEENILKGIASVRRGRERMPLGSALPLAEDLVDALRKRAPLGRIEIAGSIRRRRETVKDIDLVAVSDDPDRVMESFVRLPAVTEVIMHGRTRSTVTVAGGLSVDLRVVAPDEFGAALCYLTGSAAHNIRLREMAVRKGLTVNEYGIFRAADDRRLGGADEEDVYRLLGLPFIEPELREDRGEIEAALEGRLPSLVSLGDIRGDLHIHTRESDGAHTLEELVTAARRRGLSYLAVTDHSRGLGVANGLTPERLAAQGEEITALNRRMRGFRVLRGTEMDIRNDGTLDFPDQILAGLEVVVASIHSGFRQSRDRITRRITAAMRNPHVDIIAHPTGRLLGEREAYAVDMEEVLRTAAETGTALEINSYPARMDLDDVHARRARELGVKVAVNTDAHVTSRLDTLRYGVWCARRAWLEPADILNTLPVKTLLAGMKKGR
jgi:DNA polymerase (family 10)